MKKLLVGFFTILPSLVLGILYKAIPDVIPIHYGFNGMVDRWAGKGELIVFPIIILVLGIVNLVVVYYLDKKKIANDNSKYVLYVGFVVLLFLNAIYMYTLYTSYYLVTNLNQLPIHLGNFAFCIIGVLLILIGNIMPKVRINHYLGLRTKWSMYNEFTWHKSQRHGGIASVIAGLVILICSFILKPTSLMVISFVAIILFTVYSVAKSYLIYKTEIDKER